MRLLTAIAAALVAAICGLFGAPAGAQQADGPKTILVLDASGSMWGQIDGRAKITIAQEVVAGLLAGIGDGRVLGLTAYGHRRKGDCGDIETLVPPAAGTADEILAAVNAIKPKGKTPLSAAVIAAAEALKYEEEAATVVLVSDGRETCDMDPCEVGRRLEETGGRLHRARGRIRCRRGGRPRAASLPGREHRRAVPDRVKCRGAGRGPDRGQRRAAGA